MSIGAELGQYILQTHNSKKIRRSSDGGFEPPPIPSSEYASGFSSDRHRLTLAWITDPEKIVMHAGTCVKVLDRFCFIETHCRLQFLSSRRKWTF